MSTTLITGIGRVIFVVWTQNLAEFGCMKSYILRTSRTVKLPVFLYFPINSYTDNMKLMQTKIEMGPHTCDQNKRTKRTTDNS